MLSEVGNDSFQTWSSKNIHHIKPTCRSFSYWRTFSNRTKLLAVPVRNQFLGLYVPVRGLRGIPQSFQASSRITIKKEQQSSRIWRRVIGTNLYTFRSNLLLPLKGWIDEWTWWHIGRSLWELHETHKRGSWGKKCNILRAFAKRKHQSHNPLGTTQLPTDGLSQISCLRFCWNL